MSKDATKISGAVEIINATLRHLTDDERIEVVKQIAPTRKIGVSSILETLDATNGNVSQTARILGCSRRALQMYMQRLEIPKGKAGRKYKLTVEK
jgi:ActR/RegA family two-component response regulator